MKLKGTFILPVTLLALASCSGFYEDLDPCPQGADVSLTFTRNMLQEDLYDTHVDCAKLLLFDGNDDFFGEYDYVEGRTVNLELPVGDYKAIVYGGMSCENTDFLFTTAPGPGLKYSQVETYLKGTRGSESNRKLHDHFHGLGEFSVEENDMSHRPVTIDLTKNTNNFNVTLSYSDGSAISESNFRFELLADNHVSNHENTVQKQGTQVTYAPHDLTSTSSGKEITAHISTPRITLDPSSVLNVYKTGSATPILSIPLIQNIEKIHQDALPGSSLQEYLDREDTWNFEFTLDPESDKFTGISFKINDWVVIISEWDL